MEMPGHAAPGVKGVRTVGVLKGGRNAAQAVISDFKKKLDSLSAAGQPVTAQPGMLPDGIAVAAGTAGQEPLQMGVGILEGFGLPDGQTDISAASADAASAAAMSEQAAKAARQAQTSGQFARMLEQEQPGTTAADMPQQLDAGAGEYSGSLESTSRIAADANASMSGDETAMRQLQSKLAAVAQPEAQTGAETASVHPGAQPETAAAAQTQVRPEPQAAAAQTEASAAAMQPEAQAATTQPEAPAAAAQPEVPADTAQPAAQAAAGSVTAERPAVTEPQAAEDSIQKQPAAKTTPAPTAMVSADRAAAPQTDAAVQAEAAADTGSAQPAESAFVRDNVIRIVDRASAHAREGRYEFDVELKPEFLGKVSIRLTMQDGEIRMQIRAEDPAVRGMFSDQANALVSAMKEKGIVLSGVDITQQDPIMAGREAFSQSGNGGSQRRESQTGWITDRYGSEAFETLTPVPELLGGSSVEYLA
jgi:flagellar hook-length control protein FliK